MVLMRKYLTFGCAETLKGPETIKRHQVIDRQSFVSV